MCGLTCRRMKDLPILNKEDKTREETCLCATCWQQVQFVHLSVTTAVIETGAEPPAGFSRPIILSTLWLTVLDRIQLQLLHTRSKERA